MTDKYRHVKFLPVTLTFLVERGHQIAYPVALTVVVCEARSYKIAIKMADIQCSDHKALRELGGQPMRSQTKRGRMQRAVIFRFPTHYCSANLFIAQKSGDWRNE